MSLTIKQREQQDITILDLDGDLVFGVEDQVFLTKLEGLRGTGHPQIVLNLTLLEKLDTEGLDSLLAEMTKLKKVGGNLAIFNMKASHLPLLVEAKLETSLELFHSEQDAVDSFFADRKIKHYDILEVIEEIEEKTSVKSGY